MRGTSKIKTVGNLVQVNCELVRQGIRRQAASRKTGSEAIKYTSEVRGEGVNTLDIQRQNKVKIRQKKKESKINGSRGKSARVTTRAGGGAKGRPRTTQEHASCRNVKEITLKRTRGT